MLNWIIWNKTVWHLTLCIAQSVGAVEYTDPPRQWVSWHDTKQSDGEVPVMLGPSEIRINHSLPLLPGPLWLGVAAPDSALSVG